MATKAEPGEEELGDVEPEVWNSEWEEDSKGTEKSPVMPQPERFMTLEQARGKLHRDVWEYIKDNVWDNVVLITVPTGPGGNVNRGTGFVFLGPGNQKQVMTNYHVVKNRDSSSPIRVRFFYDDKNSAFEEREVTSGPVYYSLNGRRGEGISKGVDEEHLDFAVFDVEDIPDKAAGIDLNPAVRHYPEKYNEELMVPKYKDHIPSKMNTKEGFIIGYPRIHKDSITKYISIIEFQPDNPNDLKRQYSREGTYKGSSGSPVLLNFNQVDMDISPVSFTTLHYGVSKCGRHSVGVNMYNVIATIWDEQVVKEKVQTYMTLTRAETVLHPVVWEDVKKVWENVVCIKTSMNNFGTGFVFCIHPTGEKVVMTNSCVLQDHDRKSPILIKFFHDSPEDAAYSKDFVEREFNGDPTYYPYDGTERETQDERDFAVLHVEGIPEDVKGVQVFPHLEYYLHDQDFAERVHDREPQMNVNEGIIIGHPCGGHKCISIVQFTSWQMGELERHYSPAEEESAHYQPESSGSPVLINAKFPFHGVYALHYYKHKAILFSKVITKIYEDS